MGKFSLSLLLVVGLWASEASAQYPDPYPEVH
ncbi:hypothetical protein KOR42_42540 [Thalassoglobus neptunius]|uniref:Uncharacterized protein n=1 Tax=Thalassoglobus neptunius TaxID=1938619 RepID=A0A5C5W7W7_9PLAN|nr:hypothetical protein KOR42_42540 [Thalassoglobus neptunius]